MYKDRLDARFFLFLAIQLQVRYSESCLLMWKLYCELKLIILLLFQIPRDAKHKLVYITKKITKNIGVPDFSQTVLFGELTASPFGHVTAFLDEVLGYL